MPGKTKYTALGALVLACAVGAQSVRAEIKRQSDCFHRNPARIMSLESTGWRQGSDGFLIFSFRVNMKIGKGVEVEIHSVNAFDAEWTVGANSAEPFDFSIKSYFKQFPAPPGDQMAIHFSFCMTDGDVMVKLANRTAPASHCPDYLILDSRGSGEPAGQFSPPAKAFAAKFKRLQDGERVDMLDNPYPAAGGRWNMLGAVIKVAFLGKYHASVVKGKKWLRQQVDQWSRQCPGSRIVLTGYSQGAQAAGDVAYQLGGQVWAVVLFGDPYFNSEDGWRNRYSFSDFYHGRLGERPPLSGTNLKVVSFCHAKDPVCQNLSVSESRAVGMHWHENYQDLGEPQAAAEYLAK